MAQSKKAEAMEGGFGMYRAVIGDGVMYLTADWAEADTPAEDFLPPGQEVQWDGLLHIVVIDEKTLEASDAPTCFPDDTELRFKR